MFKNITGIQSGLATDQDCRGIIRDIHASGRTVVFRYLPTPGRHQPLTTEEASVLSEAGLHIGTLYEPPGATVPGYFTGKQGAHDANHANLLADSLGQPEWSPIFYTVDCDATTADACSNICHYFEHVRAQSIDRTVAAYGSGYIITMLKAEGLIMDAYLSASKGWSGYEAAINNNVWQVRAILPNMKFAGLTIDELVCRDVTCTWYLTKPRIVGYNKT